MSKIKTFLAALEIAQENLHVLSELTRDSDDAKIKKSNKVLGKIDTALTLAMLESSALAPLFDKPKKPVTGKPPARAPKLIKKKNSGR